MQIQINTAQVKRSDAIVQRVHKELEAALEVFKDRITRVDVHLHDDNGAKGGVDKRCLLEARVAGQQPVAVEAATADLYDSIKQAAGKLERAIRHKIERQNERRSAM
jgi:ribosomal subunit interface protein